MRYSSLRKTPKLISKRVSIEELVNLGNRITKPDYQLCYTYLKCIFQLKVEIISKPRIL